MSPVPTRFRRPSASYMIRDTRSPVLLASWNATGSRPTCSWTRTRMSAMSRWAAFETSCTRAKEPSPWTAVAPTTAPTRGSSSSTWRRPITSSMRYLVEAGRTRPATRLTAMSRRARARRPRRGFMRAQMSGSRARRRSGFRPRADCFDSRVTTRAAPLTAAFYRGPSRKPAQAACLRARRAAFGALRRSASPAARRFSIMRPMSSILPQRRQATTGRSSRCRNFLPQRHPTRRAMKWRVGRWCRILITPVRYARRIPADQR